MNISENISRINQAKVDIKNAIIAKGGTVADSDKINVYAQAIEALPSGDETVKGIIDRSITKCNIPQGTTSIGNYAFNECALTSVIIPNSVTSIGEFAFNGCTALTSVIIPDSVTSISGYAFSGCRSLNSITIGKGVTRIGASVFEGCTKLTTITVKAIKPPTLVGGSNTIPNNVTAIYVPPGFVDAYKSASDWSRHGSKIQEIRYN